MAVTRRNFSFTVWRSKSFSSLEIRIQYFRQNFKTQDIQVVRNVTFKMIKLFALVRSEQMGPSFCFVGETKSYIKNLLVSLILRYTASFRFGPYKGPEFQNLSRSGRFVVIGDENCHKLSSYHTKCPYGKLRAWCGVTKIVHMQCLCVIDKCL